MTSMGEVARQAFATAKVDPTWLRSYLAQRIAQSPLAGTVPSDGARYGIRTGAPGEWADMMARLAYHESGLKNSTVGDVGHFGSGSRGLFQLSVGDAPTYGLNGGRPFTHDQLADPRANADAAVSIASALVGKTGSIQGGMGRYWGPVQRGWTPGGGRDRALGFGEGSGMAPAPAPAQPAFAAPVAQAAPAQQAFTPPNKVDPQSVAWAMQDTPRGGRSLGALFAGLSRRAQAPVPADAQQSVGAQVAPVVMPSPAQFGLGQIAAPELSIGDPLEFILSGQVA